MAFAELEAAARTDPMLRASLASAQQAFDRAQVGGFGPLAQAGADARFQASRDLGRFLLEGLARGAMTYDDSTKQLNTMPPIDLARVFEQGGGQPPRGAAVAPGARAPGR